MLVRRLRQGDVVKADVRRPVVRVHTVALVYPEDDQYIIALSAMVGDYAAYYAADNGASYFDAAHCLLSMKRTYDLIASGHSLYFRCILAEALKSDEI